MGGSGTPSVLGLKNDTSISAVKLVPLRMWRLKLDGLNLYGYIRVLWYKMCVKGHDR